MQNKKILEEAARRFQQICEYTYYGEPTVDEADDQQQPDANQPAPDTQMPPMDNQPAGDPNAMPAPGANQMPPMDPNQAPQGDPNAMSQDPNAQAAQGPEGFNPQVDLDPNIQAQPDDNVIDVTDLTNSQEKVEQDMDKMDARFDQVIQAVGRFEEMLKSNDEKIEALKSEMEKRNPTEVEKLSLRSQQSAPFDVKPEEYWDEKQKTSNYSIEDDNNGKGQSQYEITKGDVDNMDMKSVSDSLDDLDIYHQTFRNTLGK